MIVAGCDVGSRTAKAVLMKENRIVAAAVQPARTVPDASARSVMDQALKEAGLGQGDVSVIVATGYGKDNITFADRVESEIVCHARGARWRMPSVRTIIDIGGQDAKAIKVDDNGKVIRYVYNDKCAAGTGRFLEVMAEAMEIPIENMAALGRESTNRLAISNQCVIFAETEVVSMISDGLAPPDIVCALHRAMAGRVAALARSIGVEQDVVMTGGVARNRGVFDALAEGLKVPLMALDGIDPQINGALGAALMAMDDAGARKS